MSNVQLYHTQSPNHRMILDAPREIFSPRTVDELANVVAECNRQRVPVIPRGGGTRQHLGNLPRVSANEFVVVNTTNLNRVVDYAPDDLIVTVESGLTLRALEKILREHNQFLPLDVPSSDRATVGGSLAVGQNNAYRLRYGPPRDFVLGMQVVNADGAITKAGARTVKNVAGYELHKLYVGSLGTLALITQATFKVFPLPQATTTLVLKLEANDIQTRALEFWNLPNPPTALAFASANLAPRFGLANPEWLMFVRFAGAEKTIAHARTQLPSAAPVDDDAVWNAATEISETLRVAHPSGVVLRVDTRISHLQSLIATLQSLSSTCHFPFSNFHLFGYPTTCAVFVAFTFDSAPSIEFVKLLRHALGRTHARVVVEHAPDEIKRALEVWGDAGASFPLMRALKNEFDPNQILNPGRFVGGI